MSAKLSREVELLRWRVRLGAIFSLSNYIYVLRGTD